MRKAFSLLELIFVIIIISILLSLSLSNISISRDDASFLKIKADISAVQNSLNLLKTKANFSSKPFDLNRLDNSILYSVENENIFYFDEDNSSNILQKPIITSASNYGWIKSDMNTYKVNIDTKEIVFKYKNNVFSCLSFNINDELETCKSLMQ